MKTTYKPTMFHHTSTMAARQQKVSKKYQKKTHLEHIKARPDTYVGSCDARTEPMWTFDGQKMQKRDIRYVPGLLKIFDEILVNAADNKRRYASMRAIRVFVHDDGRVSVENDGAGVPVVLHAEHNVYVPELVFGHLLSGDNYDDSEDRVVGGRNGYGAKLANIFSTTFCVETVDSKAKKKVRTDLAQQYVAAWQAQNHFFRKTQGLHAGHICAGLCKIWPFGTYGGHGCSV